MMTLNEIIEKWKAEEMAHIMKRDWLRDHNFEIQAMIEDKQAKLIWLILFDLDFETNEGEG